MKTLKILISASSEMLQEQRQFQNLIEQLNRFLRPRKIELERIKWVPGGGLEKYMANLRECEVCLTLYFQELYENATAEFDAAYNELNKGNNPHRIYLFFKEPATAITTALQEFKDSIEYKYEDFFCKFENVDTMNLQFVLKFLNLMNYLQDEQKELVTAEDGKIKIGNIVVANFDNLTFIDQNYKYFREELTELNKRISILNSERLLDPDNIQKRKQYTALLSRREEINKEYLKCQKHLLEKAIFFAQLSHEQYTDRTRRAKEAFERGDSIAADEILDKSQLDKDERVVEQVWSQNIETYQTILVAKHLKTKTVIDNTKLPIQERFNIACVCYEDVIKIAKRINIEEGKYILEYADFLDDYKKFSEAEAKYKEALLIYRHLIECSFTTYAPYLAKALLNLSHVQGERQHYTDAERNCTEALSIYHNLSEIDRNAHIKDLAQALNNLAALQISLHNYQDAETNLKKAKEIYQTLATNDPETYELEVALVLNNLASVQADCNHLKEAEENYKKSIAIFQQYASKETDETKTIIAMMTNNLAMLQDTLLHYEEAEKNYINALEIYRTLAKDNPDTYEHYLAMVLNNLGKLANECGRYEDAENYYHESLRIVRRLAKIDADAYKSYVALTLCNLCVHYKERHQYQKAEKNVKEALEIYRYLASIKPEAYEPELAKILLNFGELEAKKGEEDGDPDGYEQAEINLTEALKIGRRLQETNIDAYSPFLVVSLNAYGLLLVRTDRKDEAEKIFDEALAIFENLDEKSKQSYGKHKIMILINLALVHFDDDYKKASEIYLSALHNCQELAKEFPITYEPLMSMILINLGQLNTHFGYFRQAQIYYNEALSLYERLEMNSPGQYAFFIEEIKENLINISD